MELYLVFIIALSSLLSCLRYRALTWKPKWMSVRSFFQVEKRGIPKNYVEVKKNGTKPQKTWKYLYLVVGQKMKFLFLNPSFDSGSIKLEKH